MASKGSRDRRQRPRSHRPGAAGPLRPSSRAAARRRAGFPPRRWRSAHALPRRPALGRAAVREPGRHRPHQAARGRSGPRRPARPSLPLVSSNSGRARQTSSTGPSASAARCSTSSRKVASAQCTSSNARTSGRRAPMASTSLRDRPDDLVDWELSAREADRGGDPLDGARSHGARERPELAQRGVRRIVIGDRGCLPHRFAQGPEGDSAPVREAAALQDTARPARANRRARRASATCPRLPRRGRSPAGSAARRGSASMLPQERLQLDVPAHQRGGASARGAPSERVRPRSRYAGTRSALPFSSSGSTGSTSIASRVETMGEGADQDFHPSPPPVRVWRRR